MLVSDLFKLMIDTQRVDIYNPKKEFFLFTGVCSDIPLYCLDLYVSHIFTNNDLLAIMVK